MFFLIGLEPVAKSLQQIVVFFTDWIVNMFNRIMKYARNISEILWVFSSQKD